MLAFEKLEVYCISPRCVDNRRLFTYKHLRLGKIPVEDLAYTMATRFQFLWGFNGLESDARFELKYKNGLPLTPRVAMAAPALPGPIVADAVVNVDADDAPEMTLRPQYPSWWRTRHASQIYDWEKLMLSTVGEGEYIYQFYEQAEARRAHTQIEKALKLVMAHRLRTLEWWAEELDIDVRQLRKAGSEHLLLQFMRKPSDGDSSEAREKQVAMAAPALPGPIFADAVVNVDADDEPQMTLRPQYPSWWRTRHASQIYDWEKLMLSTIDEGTEMSPVCSMLCCSSVEIPADIVALAKKRAQDVLQGTKEFEAEVRRVEGWPEVAAAKRKANKKQKGPPEASCGGKKLTVTMEKEDSDDEEFDVEITVPSCALVMISELQQPPADMEKAAELGSLRTAAGTDILLDPPLHVDDSLDDLKRRAAAALNVGYRQISILSGERCLEGNDSISAALGDEDPTQLSVLVVAAAKVYKNDVNRAYEEVSFLKQQPVSFPPPTDINVNMMPFILGKEAAFIELPRPSNTL
ncbi:hypothetical protein AK812_SmicGene24276 [Symbiodinium microadriaticum]|uniref:Uncharacterized protein n=1 Tax=Symbiodinium microadriaticum TaxID=2951 RepID=A0A1Q9DF19_SYMMI|nr:hypothetical protein AK812_SmicGene24276 [Symbiodinium microadriaticum]